MAPTATTTSISHIEATTNRQVTIATSLDDTNLAKCKLQSQSPLFGLLPAELRTFIFALVTASDYNPSNIYASNGERMHPDDFSSRTYHTSLLQTCRRIWLETNFLPLQNLQNGIHHFHLAMAFPSKALLDIVHHRQSTLWSALTPKTSRNLAYLHYHADTNARSGASGIHWATSMFNVLQISPPHCPPKILMLSIRYADWPRNGRSLVGIGWLGSHFKRLRQLMGSVVNTGVPTFRLVLEALASEETELSIVREVLKQSLQKWKNILVVKHYNSATGEMESVASHLVLQLPIEEHLWLDPEAALWPELHEKPNEVEYRAYTLTFKRQQYTVDPELATFSAPVVEEHSSKGDSVHFKGTADGVTGAVESYRQLWASQASLLRFVEEERVVGASSIMEDRSRTESRR